jgi:hypothetical protein
MVVFAKANSIVDIEVNYRKDKKERSLLLCNGEGNHEK